MNLTDLKYPIVQLSLDVTSLDEAIETAAIGVEAGVDWLDTDEAPPKPNRFRRWGQVSRGELAAGRIAFELTNDRRKGHNIRIHTGDTCCFRPGSEDIGGTRTIGTGRTRVVLDLKPGTYTYLCSTGGYWRTQHGTLVVR